MLVGSPRDHRDDPSYTQFRAFLDRPLHAIELEDGQQQCDVDWRCGGNCFPELKLHAGVCNSHNAPAANHRPCGDIEFLADAGTQDADEVIGMVPGEGGLIATDFVGDPSAACHWGDDVLEGLTLGLKPNKLRTYSRP